MKFSVFFLLLLLNILLFTCMEGKSSAFEDKIIAVVNNEIITKSDLEESKIFSNKSLSFLIEKKIQLQIAQKKGLYTQDSEILSALDDIKRTNSFLSDKEFEDALLKEGNSLEKYKKDLKDQLTLLKLVNKEVKSKITISDQECENFYLEHKDTFLLPDEIKLAYIQVSYKTSDSSDTYQRAQKRINGILAEIKNKKSFSEVLSSYSGSSEVNINENSGFVKRGSLLKELDKAAFAMKEGDISDVISTPSGFYILKVIERKTENYKTLEEVKNDIKTLIFQNKNESVYKEWIFNLKTSSYIEIM